MPEVNLKAIESVKLPKALLKISKEISSAGGVAYLVGGWVRDCLLGIATDNYDLEIYGLELEPLLEILSGYGKPNQVGKAFGVVTMNIKGGSYDFAFPRTESKTGKGHKGFMVKPDPGLTFEKASLRRDFTINAMGIELSDMKLTDFHGGLDDLKNGILRHISEAFGEDPLRALRAVQFAARFELEIPNETRKICSRQPLEELPKERIFQELKKLLLLSKRPSIGLEYLRKMKLLRYFPELEDLVGLKQDPDWHPEGNVWEHNNMVVDAAAEIRDREISADSPDADFEKTSLMLGALCHDFGKAKTTIFKDERWRSPNHDVAGEKLTRKFLSRLTNDAKLTEQVVTYVREHLKPALYYKASHEIKPSAIRRLSLKVDISKLVRMAKADHFGRTTPDALEKRFEAGDWLLEQSRQLKVLNEKPKPMLTGKMLLSLGMEPGPAMGALIRESFELQLENQLNNEEEVLEWAKKKLSSGNKGPSLD